jgi:hypothetical protein
VAAKCRQLKMPASDGKQRLTDVADTETILRIVQSVPSPKAEPIKQWLARTGAIDLGARSVRPVDSEDTVAIPKLDTELLALAEYHERLAMVYRQQASMSTRLESVEAVTRSHDQQLLDILLRLESLETGSGVLPDMLALLRPENLSKDHQTQLKRWTSDLTYLTGWHRNMIWQDLVADFGYETFGDATDADWQRIADWFNERLAYFNKR